MDNIVTIIATVLISGIIFIPIGIVIRKKIAESKIASAESEAQRLIDLANKEAENIKKEEIFKAKEEIMQSRNELDQEIRERRGEVQAQEKKKENLKEKIKKLKKEKTSYRICMVGN